MHGSYVQYTGTLSYLRVADFLISFVPSVVDGPTFDDAQYIDQTFSG